MMSIVDSVVGSVNAILKTLECSICLELLKTPVTTGCGHFFCKFCITEVLKSNYRSPCPLCKRSFTRRSIQEAHQRQSVILAAKELAEACGHLTGLKFAHKDIKKSKSSSVSPSIESSKAKEGCKTSLSKKRKSYENETSDETYDDKKSSDKTKEKNRKSTGSVAETSDCASSNNGIIPSTNKRHRQSNADSDDDDLVDLPSLEEILKLRDNENKEPKIDNMQQEINKKFPVVRIERVTDMEISSESVSDKMDNMDISVIPDTDVPKEASVKKTTVNDEVKDNIEESAVNENRKGLKAKRKIPVINQGAKFKSKVISENKKNTLKNKTNQLNPKEKFVGKALEDKTIKKKDDYEFNDEKLVKENKEIDVKLFISPKKTGPRKDISDVSLSPNTAKDKKNFKRRLSKPQSKTYKNNAQVSSSSAEEESLISNLKEAENFPLSISICNSKKNSNKVDNTNNVKECYNLNETNIPPRQETSELDNNEPTSKPQKEYSPMDEIADTAVSVQAVSSPEASKVELVMKSPGWSRVKQVGKDFRVRKFSRLHVEKNTSNSAPLEVVDTDHDSASGNSPGTICPKKVVKLSDSIAEGIAIKVDRCNKNQHALFQSTSNTVEKSVDNVSSLENLKSVCPEEDRDNEDKNDVSGYDNKEPEMPTLIKESELVPDVDIDYDSYEPGIPNTSNSKMSSSKENNTFEFQVVDDVPLSNLKNVGKDTDTGVKLTSDVSECHDVNDLSVSANKHTGILTSQPFQLQSHGNTNIQINSIVNLPENLELPAYNVATNFNIEAMEVDNIPNGETNEDVGSLYYHKSVNDSRFIYPGGSGFSETTFGKNYRKDIQANDIHKFVKEKDLTSKYGVLDNENIYYMEHAQQTSQRLLDFCDNNRQQKALVPLGPMINQLNVMVKHNGPFEGSVSKFNQDQKFSTGLKKTSAEKTKVLKRICLTMEEIQEAFANNSASGRPETICSFPFQSGDYRLNVCVSEETLNISVLKVVESEIPHITRGKTLLLSEKNVQTSNPNTPVPSPTTILPSSNVESESSQPNSQPKDDNVKKSTNPFPYLSEYFSDSEPSEQVVSGTKETPLDDSEVFPYIGPIVNASKSNKMEQDLNKAVVNSTNDNISSKVSVFGQNTSTELDTSNNLPVTQPYQESTFNSTKFKEGYNDLITVTPVEDITPPNIETTAFVDKNIKKVDKSTFLLNSDSSPKFVDAKNTPTGVKQSKSSITGSGSVENNSSTTIQKSFQDLFDDSGEFSSDPDMAYALELVAPLKDIGEKIEASESKAKSCETALAVDRNKFSSSMFSDTSKEKNPIKTFEDIILSKNKNTSHSTSFNQKKSRLSLKSKNNSKFKRIKTYDSDDDSDECESSKKESLFKSDSSKRAFSKETPKDKPEETSTVENRKNSSPKEGHKPASSNICGGSLQDNSTFNSYLSEDMTNNSNEIAQEIEDIDEKILSVFEKLKQCGHENVLELEKQKLGTPRKNESKVVLKAKESCDISSESEDSVDIFSQSVPPTPEKTNSGDSMFKSVMYSHK